MPAMGALRPCRCGSCPLSLLAPHTLPAHCLSSCIRPFPPHPSALQAQKVGAQKRTERPLLRGTHGLNPHAHARTHAPTHAHTRNPPPHTHTRPTAGCPHIHAHTRICVCGLGDTLHSTALTANSAAMRSTAQPLGLEVASVRRGEKKAANRKGCSPVCPDIHGDGPRTQRTPTCLTCSSVSVSQTLLPSIAKCD